MKPRVYFTVDTIDNGYQVAMQFGTTKEPGKFIKMSFHSLAEVSRAFNNGISGLEMGPVYRVPKSLDYAEFVNDSEC